MLSDDPKSSEKPSGDHQGLNIWNKNVMYSETDWARVIRNSDDFFGLPGASWCLLSEEGYTRAVFVNKAQHQLLDTAASIKRIWNTWFFYYDVHGRGPTNQRRRAVDLWRRFLWRTAGHLGLPSTTDVCSVQSEHSADGHQNRSDSSLIRRWRDVVRTLLSRHLTDMMDGLTQRRTLKTHAQYKLVSWNIEEYNYC